jgi:integrase
VRDRITKRLVDSLHAEAGQRLKVYDDQLSGFGVAVHSSGRKTFFVEYGPSQRRRRMTLGQYGALTVDAARRMAVLELGKVVQGEDPMEARRAHRAIPSFGAWVDEYMEGVRRRKKQPRHDERYLQLARERWGAVQLDTITHREVELELRNVAERGHTTANRWLASVRACLEAARTSGMLSENPATRVRAFREAPPRARVLSDDEFKRVLTAVDGIESVFERAALLLLIQTGARKSEMLGARWEDVDLESAIWRIPSPKAGRPQVVPLSAETVKLLASLPRTGVWILPGRGTDAPRQDVRRVWEEVREKADVKDVTVHDLRRTFGLHMARHAGIHVASKLLRHSDIRVTAKVYAPLGVDELRVALEGAQKARGAKITEDQK